MSTKQLLFLCVGVVLAGLVLVLLLPVIIPLDILTTKQELSTEHKTRFISGPETSEHNLTTSTTSERRSEQPDEHSGQVTGSQARPSAFPRLAEYFANSNPSTPPEIPSAFPDGTPIKQPQPLSMDERVQMIKEFLKRYDEDPSIALGMVREVNGNSYTLHPNTIYVRRGKFVDENGDVIRSASHFGTVTLPADMIIPKGVKVVELDHGTGDIVREYIASGEENIYGINVFNKIAEYLNSSDSATFPDSTSIDVGQKVKGFDMQKPAGESQGSQAKPTQHPTLDDSTRRSLSSSLTREKPLDPSMNWYIKWFEKRLSEEFPEELQRARERAARQMGQNRKGMSKDRDKRTDKKP